MKLNQQGISRVTAVIVVLVLAMVVVLSFAFRSPGNSADGGSSNELPSGFTKHSSSEGKFTIGYPLDWVTSAGVTGCDDNILLMSSDPDYLGECGTDSQSQVFVTSYPGDQRDSFTLITGIGYSETTAEPFKQRGVTGMMQRGTADAQTGTGALDDGSIVIRYTFFTNNRTYVVQYAELSGALDVEDSFGEIVKTLSFRADA
ncbi:MAG TPA: hypothetical protein VD735_05585 [Candidatus Saccharimonadales bacterium]|nr:hypothetical protein [Candidatus Saccharimonadales bacterium]